MNGLRAALLRLCIAFGGCAAGHAAAAHVATPWPLLPAPAQVVPAGAGTFEVADGAALAVEGADARDARFLADHLLQLLDATGGPRLRVAGAHGAAPAIRIVIDPRAALDEAGYRLRIEAQGILSRRARRVARSTARPRCGSCSPHRATRAVRRWRWRRARSTMRRALPGARCCSIRPGTISAWPRSSA